MVQRLDADTLLVLALRRPQLGIIEIFTNEFLRPILLSSLIGLILSVLIAVGMARWISNPLKQIDQATQLVASGKYQSIPLEGPTEIKELAASFNRMSSQVQAAQKSQQDLAANVSHELKTPLTSIQGFTQAILDGVIQSPTDIRQTLQLIQTESNRMSRLVQDLISLARLESGTGLKHTPVDISGLLTNMAEKFRLQANSAGLELSYQIPVLPMILGDDDRLAQVISNLLDNAIKYTPSGGKVSLTARMEGNNIHLEIADTGQGIPNGDKVHIFERFYRSENTGSSSAKNSAGLGLAITRQIVLAHGGAIRVMDNKPSGSIFIVEIPISK